MATIGRPKVALMVTDVERRELVRLTKRAHVNRALAFRARLVLACTEAVPNTAVARRHRTSNATVGKWRTRFVERRLDGLYDEPRIGAPRTTFIRRRWLAVLGMAFALTLLAFGVNSFWQG